MGRLSQVARKVFAKVTSDMMTFSNPAYNDSSVKKASVMVDVVCYAVSLWVEGDVMSKGWTEASKLAS